MLFKLFINNASFIGILKCSLSFGIFAFYFTPLLGMYGTQIEKIICRLLIIHRWIGSFEKEVLVEQLRITLPRKFGRNYCASM